MNDMRERLAKLKEEYTQPLDIQREEPNVEYPIIDTTITVANSYESISELQQKFLNAYIANRYHIGEACIEAGISRQSYYRWMNNDEAFKIAFNDARQLLVDTALRQLSHLVDLGDKEMVKFTLTKLGKEMGFGDSIDITSGGKPLETKINIIMPNVDTE